MAEKILIAAPDIVYELIRKTCNHPLKDVVLNTLLTSVLVLPLYFCCVERVVGFCVEKMFPKEMDKKIFHPYCKPRLQRIVYAHEEVDAKVAENDKDQEANENQEDMKEM